MHLVGPVRRLLPSYRPTGGRAGLPLQALEQKGCGPEEGSVPSTQNRRHRQFRTDSVGVNHTGLANLPLQHPELMPEGKHLGAELGVGAGADEHEIGDEAHELVDEAEKHGDGSCPITPTIGAGEGARALHPPRPEGCSSN